MNRLSLSDMPSNSIPQTGNLSKDAGTENEHQSASFFVLFMGNPVKIAV